MAGGTAVRFIEEQGGAEKIFDFAAMPVKPEVREWLVRVFARRIGPPAAVRRIKGAEPAHRILARFADVLAGDPAVSGAAGVTARHLEAFRDQYSGLRSQLAYVDTLRGLLRDDPELSPETRAAVVALRPGKPAEPPAHERPTEYSDAEWSRSSPRCAGTSGRRGTASARAATCCAATARASWSRVAGTRTPAGTWTSSTGPATSPAPRGASRSCASRPPGAWPASRCSSR